MKRVVRFGGEGRKESDMAMFYSFLGQQQSQKIDIAVMDMWKPFSRSTRIHAPQADILFDKFHVIRHLSDALDEIRRSEYKRVTGDERGYIKGQRYVLLSRRENLSEDGRKNLERLLEANTRLNIAYLLREQFEQLWDYADTDDARTFFNAWRTQLKGQDIVPYEKFATMVERHWDGIAAYCRPTHSFGLGYVEGLNNKIRVIQRKAYGIRDEEYLKLKIVTAGLPKL